MNMDKVRESHPPGSVAFAVNGGGRSCVMADE